MYKLIVKITNNEGINEHILNDFKTVKKAKELANELYEFAKEKAGKEHMSVSRNNWAEWNERHFCSMTIYNSDGNNFAISFTVENSKHE